MPPGTTLVLLGFGLGLLMVTKQGSPRASPLDDQLRARAIEAQKISAIAACRARELTALWLEQKARLHLVPGTKEKRIK
jgi:hypothetical protein